MLSSGTPAIGDTIRCQRTGYPWTPEWDALVSEINAKRPVLLLIDTNGDNASDHFVPVIAYDDRGAMGKFYGFYTTWSEDEAVTWEPFRGGGNAWGVMRAAFITPLSLPIPELPPGMIYLVGITGIAISCCRHRRKNQRSEIQ